MLTIVIFEPECGGDVELTDVSNLIDFTDATQSSKLSICKFV